MLLLLVRTFDDCSLDRGHFIGFTKSGTVTGLMGLKVTDRLELNAAPFAVEVICGQSGQQ